MQRGSVPAPYDPKAVANYFLDRPKPKNGEAITQMKLHKLLYYSQGWHLAFRSKPLMNEMIEAWEYGPVVPSIYHEFRSFGAKPIDRKAYKIDVSSATEPVVWAPSIDESDKFVQALLDRVWKVYGVMSAVELSRRTHVQESPWSLARQQYPGIKNAPILNQNIRKHFDTKRQAHG